MKFAKFLEERENAPKNHEELLAAYDDQESRLLIKNGVHPGTMEPLPVHLRPTYGLAAQQEPSAEKPPSISDKPTYRMLQPKPGVGGKDKFGRAILDPSDYPDQIRKAHAAYNRKDWRGHPQSADYPKNPEAKVDRFGRKMGYDLAGE
jgi:hypothetical protein